MIIKKKLSSKSAETRMDTSNFPSTSIPHSYSSPLVKSMSILTTTLSTTYFLSAISASEHMPPCSLEEFGQGTPAKYWKAMVNLYTR